tara:strand:- start:2491 stop:4008 length:1518 start_codon:yes stop_codon:yes gene_type:complete
MNGNFYNILSKKFSNYSENICFEEESGRIWRYEDIKNLASKFSAFLNQSGLKKGSKVIVQVDKSVLAVGLYLGCLRSGIIYVPLNVAYTSNELKYFIEDINPDLIFLSLEKKYEHSKLLKNIPDLKSIIFSGKEKDKFFHKIDNIKNDTEIEVLDENDTASIIFTSGTTGKSKGAMLTHKNLSSNAFALNDIWSFKENDILIHSLPIFHVHGLFVALHTAFLSGCKIIYFEKFSPKKILKYLKIATVMMGVPTYYSRLLSLKDFSKKACKNLRLFISGSAPLTEAVFKEFEERSGHKILERYGMSETGMITSNPLDGKRIAGTVGFVLPEVSIRICSQEGEILPNNEKGIVEVKGPNVFKGYWNLEEKTKKEFRDDDFFITGDIGKIDENNRLTLFGRSSDMVISGGYNIYPKELELILDEIEGISESAVIGCPHHDLGEAIVAILISDKKDSISNDKLNKILLESIAKFKCPLKYFWLDELPRNTMGKVQKKILRENYINVFTE